MSPPGGQPKGAAELKGAADPGDVGHPAGTFEAGAARADQVQEVLRSVESLATRMADLEDAVAEAIEELGKVRRALSDLKHTTATKKQVKKLKKALDQLEVIEVGPDGAPAIAGGDNG